MTSSPDLSSEETTGFWLDIVHKQLGSPSSKARIDVLTDTLIPALTSDEIEKKPSELLTLCRILILSVSQYNYRKSRVAILQAIDVACSHEPIQKTFIAAYMKTLSELGKELFRSNSSNGLSREVRCYYLFFHAISRLLNRHFVICEEVKKVEWLAGYQIKVLNAVEKYVDATSKPRLSECYTICKMFYQSLICGDGSVWKLQVARYEEKNDFSLTAVGLLASASSVRDKDSTLKDKFRKVYETMLLASTPAPQLAIFSFRRYLNNLNVGGSDAGIVELIPTLKRAFTRNAKLAAAPGLACLSSFWIHADSLLLEFYKTMQPALKVEDAAVLKKSSESLFAAFACVRDRSMESQTIREMTKFIGDRNLKVLCKLSFLSLLEKLPSLPSIQCSTENSAIVTIALAPLFKSNNDETVKRKILDTITAWLKIATDIPAPVLTLYGGIAQPSFREMLCSSLSMALTNRSLRPHAVSLFPTLVKCLSQCPPKPAARMDFATALLCAIQLCSEDSSFAGKLDKACTVVLGPSSFLYKPDFEKKLSLPQLESIARLCFVLLEEQNIPAFANSAPVTLLLCSFTTKPLPKLQYIVAEYIIRLASIVDQLSSLVLSSFHNSLQELEGKHSKLIPTSKSLQGIISMIFRRLNVPHTLYGSLILLLSHPFVTSSQKDIIRVWNDIEVVLPIGNEADGILKQIGSEILERTVLPPSPFRHAGLRAGPFYATYFPKGIIPFVNKIFEGLKSANIAGISTRELEIYRTPEGTLYDTSIAEKQFQSRSGPTGSDQSTKTTTSNFVRPSQQTAKNPSKKKLAKKQGPTREEIERKKVNDQISLESGIRADIAERTHRTITNFSLLTSIVQSNGQIITPEQFASISSLLLLLLNHSLVRSSAAQCHKALASCTSFSPLFGQTLGVLIQRIYGLDEAGSEFSYAELCDTLVLVLKKLLTLISISPLNVSSFIYCTPLIETALLRPTTFRMQQNAITLFTTHAIPSYPPGRSISALLEAIERNMMIEKCENCLIKVCEGEIPFFPPELLQGCYSESKEVRHAVLLGLAEIDALDDANEATLDIGSTLWFMKEDPIPANATLAAELWTLYEQPFLSDYSAFYNRFGNPSRFVRETIGKAICTAVHATLSSAPTRATETFHVLCQYYESYLPPEPVMGVRGLEYSEDLQYIQRQAVAFTLKEYYSVLQENDVIPFFTFLAGSPLIDGDELVRKTMIQAGIHVTEQFGESQASAMLSFFESQLDGAGHGESGTLLREGMAIFLGSLAKKFDLGKEKTSAIIKRLIDSLETPSESVQLTISESISPLMKSVKSETPAFLTILYGRIQSSSLERHKRRGAALGIAAIGKGLGVPGLSHFLIMDKLKEMLCNRKSMAAREGGLFAFEALSKRMKRGFEASAISKLDCLLACYGDNSPIVRDAAAQASKEIMSQLSNHGVKRVIPALTKGLGDRAWRTQTASAELLGSMAFCAPKQLSSCLPDIVPSLITSLASTHLEVQKSSKKALGHIASVIRNPEIQHHIPVLLQALDNPTLYLEDALEKLIQTNYVHVIDAPSLALFMPILQRGLHSSRSTSTKKKAASIIGNMTKLADHKDLIPYLDVLVPALQNTLVDSIPETRSVSAAAFGYLVKGLGEERFPTLVDSLYEQLQAAEGGIVRSGAAQGLAQVFSSLPEARFETFLPTMILNGNDSDPNIREGAVCFFVFIPSAFSKNLEKHLPRIIPIVLQGLADDTERVREASMRAGQAIISEYGSTSLDTLLPLLEGGLFHMNWRIRLSSVTLLGDLLQKVSGADATPEDELADTAENAKMLYSVLGEYKHKNVLSALYLIRNDVVRTVQQQALIVWKSSVYNTPEELRRILPVLLERVIQCLGNENEDRRMVGSRTLGDLVKKLPEKILPTMVPIIEEGLRSTNEDTRQGVCHGLAEIVTSSRRHYIASYLDSIIPAVRTALCDTSNEVRGAATSAFDALYAAAGGRVIDEIVPKLLEETQSGSESAQHALEGIRDIVGVRAKVILPHLIPSLLVEPISSSMEQALISVAEVSSTHLYSHLSQLLRALLPILPTQPSILRVLEAIVIAVKKDGIHILISDILKFSKNTEPICHQVGAAELMNLVAAKSPCDYKGFVPQLLSELLENFSHDDGSVTSTSLKALTTLVKALDKASLPSYVMDIYRQLRAFKTILQDDGDNSGTYLSGFGLAKGLSPLLTITLQGLRFGNPTERETSAKSLGLMIHLTDPSCMRPYVPLIAGPLIRVMGDRFSESVKVAILNTMGILLDHAGTFCKPFVMQLQTTFIRGLNDPSDKVRMHAARDLGKLMVLSTRIDQLLTELLNSLATFEKERKGSLLVAMANVLVVSGSKVSEPILLTCHDKCGELLFGNAVDSLLLAQVSDVMAHSLSFLPASYFDAFFTRIGGADAAIRSICVTSMIRYCPDRITGSTQQAMISLLQSFVSSKDVDVRTNAATMIQIAVEENSLFWIEKQSVLVKHLASLTMDTATVNKLAALNALKFFAKNSPGDCKNYLSELVPVLMERVKDRTSLPVKLAAERTLFYVLQVNQDDSVLSDYATLVGNTAARPVMDYCKRVLSKLSPDESK